MPDDHLWALLILSAVFIFGAMLALMLCALTEGSEVKLKNPPRMATSKPNVF